MTAFTHHNNQMTCNNCGSSDLYRVAKSFPQRLLNFFFSVNNYSCSDCDHRGFKVKSKRPKSGLFVTLALIVLIALLIIIPAELLPPENTVSESVPQPNPAMDRVKSIDDISKSIQFEPAEKPSSEVLLTDQNINETENEKTPNSTAHISSPKVENQNIDRKVVFQPVYKIRIPDTNVSFRQSTEIVIPSTENSENFNLSDLTDSSILSINLIDALDKKILNLNPEKYTIQVATVATEANAQSLMQKLKSGQVSAPSFYYLSIGSINNSYPVLLGYFDTSDSAAKMISGFPGWIKKAKPIVRQISKVQASIRQRTQ